MMEKLCGTKALIVDMRCYPREFMVDDFVGRRFVPHAVEYAAFLSPVEGLPGVFRTEPCRICPDRNPSSFLNPDCYKGEVFVLVNAATQSQAEYTVMAFQAAPHCTVIGTRTAGADGDVVRMVMPGHNEAFFQDWVFIIRTVRIHGAQVCASMWRCIRRRKG